MSSYAGLYVRGREIFTWRNEIEPTFLFLYTSSDVRRVPRPPDEVYSEDDTEAILLVAPAKVLSDRLDALGIGRRKVDELFQDFRNERLESFIDLAIDHNHLTHAADLLKSMSLTDWVKYLVDALESPSESPKGKYWEHPESLENLLELWEWADPRFLLRAVLLACKPDEEITLDVSDLVGGGWIQDNFDPQSEAIEHFSYALANGSPAVIITEGSSDAAVLRSAIAIRYPHLESFIKFFDFGDNLEGSAAAGVRTLKSFLAAGISNRVVLLLDNDSAAKDALRNLAQTKLPKHYTVTQYPELELGRNYPTMGPNGLSHMNVNGLAASIELYLGEDVLKGTDGDLIPVQWKAYLEGVGAYQGEVMGKRALLRKFRTKVKLAINNPTLHESQDWSGLDAIVNDLLEELRSGV